MSQPVHMHPTSILPTSFQTKVMPMNHTFEILPFWTAHWTFWLFSYTRVSHNIIKMQKRFVHIRSTSTWWKPLVTPRAFKTCFNSSYTKDFSRNFQTPSHRSLSIFCISWLLTTADKLVELWLAPAAVSLMTVLISSCNQLELCVCFLAWEDFKIHGVISSDSRVWMCIRWECVIC